MKSRTIATSATAAFPKFNKKLYDSVIKSILEEPKRIDMGIYALTELQIRNRFNSPPKCNTVGCFAGWAVALDQGLRGNELALHYPFICNEATKFLGLTSSEAFTLFHTNHWPNEYQNRLYATESGTKEYARAVADFALKFRAKIMASRKAKAEKAEKPTKKETKHHAERRT